jgi:hypothetical protein
MKKILITTLFTILLTANQEILEDLNITISDTNITKIEDSNLTEDELIAEFMKLEELMANQDKEVMDEKAKTKAVMKLSRTVNELAENLGIED